MRFIPTCFQALTFDARLLGRAAVNIANVG